MRRRTVPLLLLSAALALLAGCGQKGDLMLPTRPTVAPAAATTVAPPAATPAATAPGRR